MARQMPRKGARLQHAVPDFVRETGHEEGDEGSSGGRGQGYIGSN